MVESSPCRAADCSIDHLHVEARVVDADGCCAIENSHQRPVYVAVAGYVGCARTPQVVEQHPPTGVDDCYIDHFGIGIQAGRLRVEHQHVVTVEKVRPSWLRRCLEFLCALVAKYRVSRIITLHAPPSFGGLHFPPPVP